MDRRAFLGNAGLCLAGLPILVDDAVAYALRAENEPDRLSDVVSNLYWEVDSKFNPRRNERVILVDGNEQKLYLVRGSDEYLKVMKAYDVSTGKTGFGNEIDSNKTPRGIHRIKKKYGEGERGHTLFHGRYPTKQLARITKEPVETSDDLVTSRILWLDGLEEENTNSLKRHIYIHGTNEEGLIGRPVSDGCIRMRNRDVIQLFGYVRKNTYVNIRGDS